MKTESVDLAGLRKHQLYKNETKRSRTETTDECRVKNENSKNFFIRRLIEKLFKLQP